MLKEIGLHNVMFPNSLFKQNISPEPDVHLPGRGRGSILGWDFTVESDR